MLYSDSWLDLLEFITTMVILSLILFRGKK